MIKKEENLKFVLSKISPENKTSLIRDFENILLDIEKEKRKPFTKYFVELPKQLENVFLQYLETKKEKLKSYNSDKNKTIFEF